MALTKVTGQVINNTTDLVVGVTTVGGGLSATDGFFSGIVTFSSDVSVGGTLTYEDVTNIDSVGLITARNGIVVGSGITLSKDGDIFATGVTTTGSLVSSGDVTANGGDMTISGSSAILHLVDTNDNPNYRVQNIGGTFQIYDATTDTARFSIASGGAASFGGNVSLGDSKYLNIGAGSDLKLSHDSNNSIIANSTGELLIDSSIISLRDASNNSRLRIEPAGNVRVEKNISVIGIATVGSAVTISESGIEASGIGITCANINGGKIGGRRNLIFNGAMVIAQRGTTSTSTGYQTVDRMRHYHAGADEAPTYAQVDVSSGTTPYTEGFRKAFKFTNGNQTSGAGASDAIELVYRMEAQDIAKSGWNYKSSSSFITLSFWIKSSVAQNFYGHLTTSDGTQYNYPYETGSLTADTWTKIVKTIPGNTNLQFDNNADKGIEIKIVGFRGTTYTGSGSTLNTWAAYASGSRMPDNTSTWWTTNDATLEITGWQLEVGSQATPFEHRTFGDDYRDCLRYYYESRQDGNGFFTSPNNYSSGFVGFGLNGNKITAGVRFPVVMRGIPGTVEMVRPSDGSTGDAHIFRGVSGSNGASDVDFGTVAAIDIGAHGFLYWSCNSGVTQGAAYLYHILVDAEI